MANDLTDDFLRPPIVGFGASFIAEEGLTAFLKKEGAKLEVTLAAKTKFGSNVINAFSATFAFNKHSEFTGNFVVIGNGKRAEFTFDALLEKLKRNHGRPP